GGRGAIESVAEARDEVALEIVCLLREALDEELERRLPACFGEGRRDRTASRDVRRLAVELEKGGDGFLADRRHDRHGMLAEHTAIRDQGDDEFGSLACRKPVQSFEGEDLEILPRLAQALDDRLNDRLAAELELSKDP